VLTTQPPELPAELDAYVGLHTQYIACWRFCGTRYK
jgi:hypothetical protein